jgi:hypothetical protein
MPARIGLGVESVAKEALEQTGKGKGFTLGVVVVLSDRKLIGTCMGAYCVVFARYDMIP